MEKYYWDTSSEYGNEDLPIFSIILICKSTLQNKLIVETIFSILEQTAPNWELLVVTNEISLGNTIYQDERIRFISGGVNTEFFELVNSAIYKSRDGLVTFIQEGDKLSGHAIKSLTQTQTQKAKCSLIVSDEDSLDEFGKRYNPIFKPDWNPDYLSNYNYFSKAVIYDKELLINLGGFNPASSDPFHDLALRATARLNEKQIGHVEKILFHYKQNKEGVIHRIKYKIPQSHPLVTLIIPIKDQLELLKSCLDGILNNTKYKNIEIIIIDNQSKLKETSEYLDGFVNDPNIHVLEYNKPFNFSKMNNIAVQKANGSILCFLNNDVTVINDGWLTEMISHACRPEIGCVGAKLFYPDGTIQHAGVILGLKGYASHAFKGFAGDSVGYCNRLVVTHNVSAVTAACLVMRKKVFEEVGGFDAINLKVAYNDVDLCLKVRDAGYRNLFTPHAQLVHFESKSRGKKRKKEQQKQLREESSYLLKKWGGVLFSDSAYNKNLTLVKEDFSLGFDRINE